MILPRDSRLPGDTLQDLVREAPSLAHACSLPPGLFENGRPGGVRDAHTAKLGRIGKPPSSGAAVNMPV